MSFNPGQYAKIDANQSDGKQYLSARIRAVAMAFLTINLTGPIRVLATGLDSPFMTAMKQMMTLYGLMNSLSDNSSGLAPSLTSPGQMAPYGMNQPFSWAQSAPWSQSMPWGQQMPWGQTSPWQQGFSNPSWPSASPDPTSGSRSLEGRWFGSNGALLAVRSGLARLYLSESEHQDFFVQVTARELLLRSAQNYQISTYEYAVRSNLLLLKNPQGVTLQFRRIAEPASR